MKKFLILLSLSFILTGCSVNQNESTNQSSLETTISTEVTTDNIEYIANDIPVYNGTKIIELNGNVPTFDLSDANKVFENYSELDELGRCGVAYANICKELMPTEERGAIGHIKPSGWHTVKYNDLIDGNYLYNRCHLIAFCLAGENDNELNLVTGTRSFNVDLMYKYEDMVNDYMKANPNNHVLYRVTPIFVGDELVCRGVQIEAQSIEDNEICFNVFCYNVQDYITINYLTGDSSVTGESLVIPEDIPENNNISEISDNAEYVINTSSHKIHTADCRYASSNNTEEYNGSIEELENNGYTRCKVCMP